MSFMHEETRRLRVRMLEGLGGDGKEEDNGNMPNVTNPHFLNLVVFSKD